MADDLNTDIKIGADASGVEAGVSRAKRSLKDLGDSAKKAGQDAGAGMASVGAGGDKAAKDVERATKNMQGSLQRLLAEQKAGAKGSREYYEALADTRGISRNAIKPILDQIDAAKSKTLQAKTAADSWTSSLGKVEPLVAAAFSGAAITGFLGKVVSVQREFDVLNSSLKTVTGSSAAAEREMAWLKDFAKETPFGLAQATRGFVQMKALGLDPTRAALTSFGNTASAMGKDLNQMIEAVADASTGEFERLKEFGIKAKKEGDSVSLTFQGVTTTIKNNAAEITKYLENIGNTSFGGAMEERAKTLDGTIAALGDTWDELFRTVSTNNVGSLIFDSVTLANGALEDATTILKAMGGAAQDASRDTGALSTIQNGIATVFETVAVLGANLKYVLVQIGNEIGGLAAQVAQAAQFNFAGVRAIREQMVADAEAARREIDATTERILNARKAQEEYARWSTRNASAATDPRRIDLGGSTPRAGSGGAGKAVKETLSDYDKLIKKLSEDLPKAAAEAEAAQMGYNKAQTEFLALAASPAWAKFTNDQRATVAALFENKIASEQSAEAAKTLAKANLDAAASRDKYLTSLSTGLDKIQADIAAQIEATERMGLSKEAIAELDAAKLEMLATDLELQAIKAMDRNLDQQTYDALKKQAAAYRELGIAKKGGAAKEAALEMEKANAEAAKKAQEDWERAAEQINSSLTDALLRGFESGKDFAKNMRDTVVNMFKTLVLRPIISAVINPVAGAITGALGLAGTANAAASGASTLGGIGNIASLGTNLFSSGLGSTISGAIGSGVGALFGTTAGNAALGTSLGLGAGSATAAAAAAAQAGGASAAAAASAASTGASVAGAIPYIGAAVAALMLLAGKFKGETRYGGGFEVVNGKAFRTTGDVTNTLPESAIVQSVQGTFDSINKILSQYGSQFVATNIKAGIETSGKGRGGVFAGGLLSGGGATDIKFGKFFEDRIGASLNPEEAVKAFGGELNKAVIAALQAATDLPKYVQRQIESVDVNALGADKAAELLQTIGNLPNVLLQGFGTTRDQLAQQFAQGLALGDATAAGQSVADTLVASIEASLYNDAAGKIFDIVNSGIVAPMLDAIATGASVSEALSQATIDKTIERAKAQASALSELFGNAEFVSALEQIRTTVGEALGQAGDAFGYTPKFQLQAAQQIDTAAQSADQSAKEAAKAWEDINKALASDRLDADIALLRAMGQEEAALKKERARSIVGYDAYQIGLYDGTQAILSQVTALEKQAEATKLARERAAELASTLASELPGAIAKFLSPDQRLAAGYTGIASDLSKAGINVGADALAAASLDQIAAAAMAVYNLGSTSDETRLALVRAVSGIKDLRDAALDLQATAVRTAATAAGNALGARNNAGSLLDRIDSATGGKGDTYSRMREAELWTALQTASYQQQIELSGELTGLVLDRYQVERDAARQQLDYAKQLKDYVNSLTIGNLSPKTMSEKLAEAGRQYQDTLGLAQGGDKDAQGRLQGASNAYLELARQYYASSGDYTAIFESVTGSLSGLGDSLMTDAERQLSVSSASLDELKSLRGVLEGAYATAQQDYLAQQSLLSGQLTALQAIEGGTAAARDIVQGLPALLAAQLQQQSQAAAGAIDAALTKPLAIKPSGADLPTTIVTPAPIDWSGYQQGNDALVAEVKALREEVKQLREERKAHDQVIVQGTVAVAEEHARRIVDGVGNAVQQGLYQASVAKGATYK